MSICQITVCLSPRWGSIRADLGERTVPGGRTGIRDPPEAGQGTPEKCSPQPERSFSNRRPRLHPGEHPRRRVSLQNIDRGTQRLAGRTARSQIHAGNLLGLRYLSLGCGDCGRTANIVCCGFCPAQRGQSTILDKTLILRAPRRSEWMTDNQGGGRRKQRSNRKNDWLERLESNFKGARATTSSIMATRTAQARGLPQWSASDRMDYRRKCRNQRGQSTNLDRRPILRAPGPRKRKP